MDNHQVNMHEKSDLVNISDESVHRILTEDMDIKKYSSSWVLPLLTLDQKLNQRSFGTFSRQSELFETLVKPGSIIRFPKPKSSPNNRHTKIVCHQRRQRETVLFDKEKVTFYYYNIVFIYSFLLDTIPTILTIC